MIIVFLVDTSASMNQKFSNGMSALECTKSGIEHLVKHLPQVKPAERHNDKYMLVTYDEGTACIKSSLKEPLPHLIKELKVLKAQDMSNPGSSLSTTFDILNAYRVHHNLDTPASGRFPGTIEPTIVMWFTDGGRQSSPAGILDRLNIPGVTSAGVDYYHEPFRWDQRLYTIFLEPNAEMVDPQLSILSTVMGGTSYRVRTLRHMLQAMDCMLGISKIPPTQYSPQAVLHIYGVVVNFEDLIVDPRRPNTANHHQLVYVNPNWLNPQTRHSGFFPIPEPYWPEENAQRIPTRNAQPTLHYHTKEEKPVDIPDGFPYDKYVLAPCPMTQELLTRPPGTCWPPLRNALKRMGLYNVMPGEQAVLGPAIQSILISNKSKARVDLDRLQANESSVTTEAVVSKKRTLCTNAFDVPRSELISVLGDLKVAFFKELQLTSSTSLSLTSNNASIFGGTRSSAAKADPLMDSDDLHTLPIADMGIYQDRMQKIQRENLRDPLRDEESVKSLQKTMFGNPYKQDKKVSIDEENEASAADDSISSNSSSSGSSWSSILGGRKRKPRRRSVSPTPFPLEKIPSLTHGARFVSGKVQVLSLGVGVGAPNIPALRIVVQESFAKTPSTEEELDGISRPLGMHDGEDESEEEDDFRRAMFNSDEMEMDGDDEAARLRADTPMPGGIGLDDDDEAMDDIQRAQDLIPPPIATIELEDIEQSKAAMRSSDMETDEYAKHQEGIQQDLEQINGSSKPVFQSLVYDPTALMELQSIPSMIPDRTAPGAHSSTGDSVSDSNQTTLDMDDSTKSLDKIADNATAVNGLTPIPILLPPANGVHPIPSNTSMGTDKSQAGLTTINSKNNISNRSTDGARFAENGTILGSNIGTPETLSPRSPLPVTSAISSNVMNGSSSLPSPSQESEKHAIQESPIVYRNAIIDQLKKAPKSYNESMVMEMLWKIESSNWTREQKRSIVTYCLMVAKGFRRHPVELVLETLRQKFK
ncbi:Integrator complex subunit 6-like [Linnemannia zychae]|nr:Integrator complex subunit 6-like [Linnemannia zychae]